MTTNQTETASDNIEQLRKQVADIAEDECYWVDVDDQIPDEPVVVALGTVDDVERTTVGWEVTLKALAYPDEWEVEE